MSEFKSFYKTAGGEERNRCLYPDRLDLYGRGCYHDCKYCYAKSLLDFRGLWDADSPSKADVAEVRKVVARLKPGSVIRLGGMTDCFQPAELESEITYRVIQMLNQRGVHYLIVTKSCLPATEKYMEVFDHKLAHFQVSISCTDEAMASSIERCAAPSCRIKAAEKLSKAGFDVSLRLSLYLYQYTDYSVLERADVPKLLVEFLRVNHWVEKWLPIDTSEYTHKEGGYRHLPLARKMQLLIPLNQCFEQLSVCEDVDDHYQRFKWFFNENPRDCCNLRMGD